MLPTQLSHFNPDVTIASLILANSIIKKSLTEVSQRLTKLKADDNAQINYLMDLIRKADDLFKHETKTIPQSILSGTDINNYYAATIGSKSHPSYMFEINRYLKQHHIGETSNPKQHHLVNQHFENNRLISETPIQKAQIKPFLNYAIQKHHQLFADI